MKIVRSNNKCHFRIYYNSGATILVSADDSYTALKLLEAFVTPLNTPATTLVAIVHNIAMVRRLAPFKQMSDIVEPEPTMKIAV